MKPTLRRLFAVLACVVSQSHAGTAHADESTHISATAGAAFDASSVYVALLEARTEVTEQLSLAAAVAHLDVDRAPSEAQLRLMAFAHWNGRHWSVENRHLLSVSTASVERYRVRVRAVRPRLLDVGPLSARAFDEVFFDLDRQRLIRNNVALGLGLQLTPALAAEVYRVWEENREVPDNRYVLGLITYRF